MQGSIGFILTNLGGVLFFIALFFIFIQSMFRRNQSFYEISYSWISLLPVGITSIYAFIMHAFYPEFTAFTIGWNNSPFQYEVAIADLPLGTIAILSFKASYPFRLATVIAITIWLWGDALGHAYQLIVNRNYTTGNAGSWFWMDILLPFLLIFCLIRLKNQKIYNRNRLR